MDDNNNPFRNPRAWDGFTLDGTAHPGLADIQQGGECKDKIEGMQGPGDDGAFPVVRGSELGGVTYLIRVWTPQQLAQLGTFLNLLKEGRKKKPRKVYEHVDHRIAHTEIARTMFESMGPVLKVGAGMWGVIVGFKEWRKRKASGGPVRGKSEGQKLAEDAKTFADQAQAEFDKQVKAMQKAG